MADVSGLIMTVLGLSFNVTSMLYRYAKDVKGARGDIQQLSNELFALTGVLQHIKLQKENFLIEKPAEQSFSEELNQPGGREVLQECIEFLQELHQKLMVPESRFQAKIQRMKWPFQGDEMKQHLQRLERVKTYFMLALMSDEIDVTRQIASQISDLRSLMLASTQERLDEQSREKYRKVMEWLSPVDPRLSYEKILKSRTMGSGVWFTESKKYMAWRESATDAVFWLNGITGAGKTTLMTTAVENVISRNHGQYRTAYFYCSFSNSESLDIGNILGSILAQLCEPNDKVYHRLNYLYDDRLGDKLNKPIPLEVNNLIRLVIEQVQSLRGVYIFVDAINECGDVYEVLASFDAIIKSLSTETVFHMFLSSVNERGIESLLCKIPNLSIETLSPRDIWNDVHLYVEANLEAQPRLRHYNPELKAEIRLALTGKADGMFRYVYCQLDLLSRLRTPGAVREALNSLPPTLDQTYERLLVRIDGEEDRRLTREILEILAFSFRPLKLIELCNFLQITPGLPVLDESKRLTDPADVLGICGSFLSYQKETGVVALAHHSVKTYLISNLPQGITYYQLRATEAHRNLATKCLAYLSFDAFSSGPCIPLAKFGERLWRFPLFEYAGEHWALHTQTLERYGHHELGESLWQILRPFLFSAVHDRGNFDAWVQLLTPSSKSIYGTSPLYYAASFGLPTVVQYLLDQNVHIEARGGRGGATPLNIASFRGYTSVVKLLLECGADPDAADEAVGLSAIEWAKENKHRDVLTLLTSRKAGSRYRKRDED